MTTKDDELRRRQEARAAKAVGEIIEDLSTRDELGDEWRCTTLAEQESIKRIWHALVMKAILAMGVLAMAGCSTTAKVYTSNPATAKVEASHIMAYAARKPRESQPEPKPTPKPDDGAEPTAAELAEYSAPEKLSWLQKTIKTSIVSAAEEEMGKANLTWEKIRERLDQVERIATWVDSFPAPKPKHLAVPDTAEESVEKPVEPAVPVPPKPKGLPRLLIFTASWCGPCKVLHDQFPKMRERGWRINEQDATATDAHWLYIDVEAHPSLAAKYAKANKSGVYEVPQFYLIDSDGAVIDRGELDKIGFRVKPETLKAPDGKPFAFGAEGLDQWYRLGMAK